MLPPLKLKNILELIQREAAVSGRSRTGGGTAWDYYVVRNFDADKEYVIEKDSDILDTNKSVIGSVSKGSLITILTPDLTEFGKRKYATIKTSDDITGLITISAIRKPTQDKSGLLGGKQSKETTPANLGISGTYPNYQELIMVAKNALNAKYPDAKFNEIKRYLNDCMSALSGGSTLNEVYKKSFMLKGDYDINEQDINTLSKNFGEILGGIFILATNKKAKTIDFPVASNTPLYDFILNTEAGRKVYYSVKSHGGSSTSLENLNFLLDNFQKVSSIYSEYKDELEVINSLINNKLDKKTTLSNIEDFYNTRLPEKIASIIEKLNSLSSFKIESLSQENLTKWLKHITDEKNNISLDQFKNVMHDIYDTDLDGSYVKDSSLEKMYKLKSADGNGYLYYPLGSYITKYLNDYSDTSKKKREDVLQIAIKNAGVDETKPFVVALNTLLNYGSFIYQLNIDLGINKFDIIIESFKTKKFRFSYNAVASSPGNRPIGFSS